MAKLTVVLDDKLMYALRVRALADRKSVSSVVRSFVEAYAGGGLAAGEVGGGDARENRAGGVASRGGATGSASGKQDHGASPAANPSKCRRAHLHHINHGGNPCKECGWPTGDN
jgi:hypothetical protein